MKRAAIIGHPVSHSKSPLIHNYWIKKHGIDAVYEAIDIAPENLERELRRLIEAGYVGFNFTIPHKEAVYKICDDLDDTAAAVKAVNTVIIKNGKIYGNNTDGFGFIENIRSEHPDFDFSSGPAYIWGAGGASRSVAFALLEAGAPECCYTNRTYSRAKALSADIPGEVIDWENRNHKMGKAKILVNTTSSGMIGQPKLEFDLTDLPKDALVTDVIYTPLMTDLLKAAQERGNPIVTGIGMLLHQARPAFKAWFGVMPEVDEELIKLVLK